MSISITVVLPIYNVETWLPRCMDSILEQSFKNYELILIDDGSSDRSREICDEYAQKDIRIKTIHKENGGASSARNAGIEVATGKYIVFIDPDDKISQNYLFKLYNIAEGNRCDSVVCGYQTVPTNKGIIPNFQLNTVMDGRDFILSSSNIHSKNDLCFSWRYIYKLSILKEKNIRFNEQVFIGEDVIFNLEYLLHCNRVYAISDCLYFYTINNPDSLMRVAFKPKLESSLILQYKIRKQISQMYELLGNKQYKKDMANYYLNNIFSMVINNLKNSKSIHVNSDLRRIVNYEMFTDSFKEVGFSYQCGNFKEYLYYLALKFRVYPIIFGMYKKNVG